MLQIRNFYIKELTEIHEANKKLADAKTILDYLNRILKKFEKKDDAQNTILNAVKFGIQLGELKVSDFDSSKTHTL